MPELPEVETVRRGLEIGLRGRMIRRVHLHRPDLRYPFPDGLAEILEGGQIDSVRRRAKFLLLDTGEHTLIAHLGMSGRFLIRPAYGESRLTHDHMVWELDAGHELVYHDPRRFGFVLLTERACWAEHPQLKGLGVEPLGPELSADYLRAQMEGRRVAVKQWLMDQRVLAGIGNIYACEALYRCGLHPATPAQACGDYAEEMVTALREVLEDAIASGGSTLRNYATAAGDTGYFQHRFRVYGHAGAACDYCGTTITSQRIAGRSSFFCPSCQPMPGA